MPNVDQQIIDALDKLASDRFALERQREAINHAYASQQEKAQARHADLISAIESRIATVDAEIWKIITNNRRDLIASGKKSLVTIIASFQFRNVPGKTTLTDAKGAMKAARSLGIVRRVSSLTVTWKLKLNMLLDYLKKHPEHNEAFADYLEITSDRESLSMKPNSTYAVTHDSANRVSPPSITIQPPPES